MKIQKKLVKYALIGSSIAAVAGPSIYFISRISKDKGFSENVETQSQGYAQAKLHNTINFALPSYVSAKDWEEQKTLEGNAHPMDTFNPLIEVANKADINFFWGGNGTITYYDTVKIALQAETEVRFYRTDDKRLNYQQQMDDKFFEDFLKNNKKESYPNSKVIAMPTRVGYELIADAWNYAKNNPDKKINIWWNSNSIQQNKASTFGKGILSLAGFQNVNINLLEDGSAMDHHRDTIVSAILKSKSMWDLDGFKQYAVTKWFNNVRSWFTSKEFIDVLKDKLPNVPFEYFSREALTNGYGHSDSKGNYIPVKIWPKIIGMDWTKVLAKIKEQEKLFPNKKRLLILGTYPVLGSQFEYAKHIWEKYHNEYNIFYKGHPGHPFGMGPLNKLMKECPGFFTVESQIASEELTRDNADQGMYFDNYVLIGYSGAADGFQDPVGQFLEGIKNSQIPWDTDGNVRVGVDGYYDMSNKTKPNYSEKVGVIYG